MNIKASRNRIVVCILIVVAAAAALLHVFHQPQQPAAYGVELLKNGNFEQISGEGLPEHWLPDAYNRVPGVSLFEVADGFQGQGILIRNLEQNDARFAQQVTVIPNTIYKLSGRVKANVLDGRGASLSIADVYTVSESVLNTQDEWQHIAIYGRTTENQTELTIWARVGGYSADSSGEAAFDDISLIAVKDAPEGVNVESWHVWRGEQQEAPAHGRPVWPLLLLVGAVYIAAALWMVKAIQADDGTELTDRSSKRVWAISLWLVLLLALVTRLLAAYLIPGYGVDIGCFTSWANRMHAVGPAEFYLTEAHSDYPPGYMLALWPLGIIGSAVGGGATEMMVKLPAIIADTLTVAVLYWYASKHMRPKAALLLASVYALNPLTYAAGAAWGQTDSIPALLLVLVILLAWEGKWSFALPVYVLSALMKPQALMFGPLGLAALVVDLIARPQKGKARSVWIGVGASLVVAAVIVLPFSPKQEGWDWLIQLYGGTMNYYAYATVNATNLAFLFGLNWQPVTSLAPILMRLMGAAALIIPVAGYVYGIWKRNAARQEAVMLLLSLVPAASAAILPVSISLLGVLLMISGFLVVLVRYVFQRDIETLPMLGAVMLILFCVLGAMMHERYLFPAAVLLLMAYVRKRDKRLFWLFIAVSLLAFLNTGIVLDRGVRIGGVQGHLEAPLFGIVSESGWLEYAMSLAQVAMAGWALYVGLKLSNPDADVLAFTTSREPDPGDGGATTIETAAYRRLTNPSIMARIRPIDWGIMIGITALYAVLAFTNLGDTTAPENPWVAESSNEETIFDLGQSRSFQVVYYGGLNWRDSDFEIAASDDKENWLPFDAKLEDGDLYSWQYQTQLNPSGSKAKYSSIRVEHQGRYVRVVSRMIGTTILEIQFRDAQTGQWIPAEVIAGNGDKLIDEQDMLPGEPSWRNGMYFDEIYHARTAFEHLNAMRGVEPNATYEVSHPPLGKLLMSFSIMIFGMNPFGWRFAGALAGVLMLPGMYLLGLLMTRKRLFAAAAMLLFTFDTMHFTQTRIATIDSFATLFIIWSYYFMFRYFLSDDWSRRFRSTLWNLALSGLFMGLAVASKWTGIYAGLGLAVIFFWAQWRRMQEGIEGEAVLRASQEASAVRIMCAAQEWRRRLTLTLLSCLLFFVAIPAAIYVLSFTPWFMRTPGGLTVRKVLDASASMLNYHAEPGRGMDHYFYSPWYQWPVIYKPMWFYSTPVVDGMGSSIITFGNPAVWWGGLLGLIVVFAVLVLRKTKTQISHWIGNLADAWPMLLVISFLAQYLPWVLVPRGTYIYHYFPAVPFIILCMLWVLHQLYLRHRKGGMYATIVYLLLTGVLFIAFFPYASGVRAPIEWLNAMKWFPGWLHY